MKTLQFHLCGVMKDGLTLRQSHPPAPSTLLDVDVRDVARHFETAPLHTQRSQGGWGIGDWMRYERAIQLIEASTSVEAPALRLNGAEDALRIEDGRHRLQALLNLGFTDIQIAVPLQQAEKIAALLLQARQRP